MASTKLQQIITSKLPSQEYPELPLGDFIYANVRGRSAYNTEQITFIDGDTGSKWRWDETSDVIERFAGGLADLGVTEGSIVAIVSPNCPEFAIAFHAVTRLAATVTTVNPQYTANEIQAQFEDCSPAIAITISDKLNIVVEAAQQSSIETIILLDQPTEKPSSDDNARVTVLCWKNCLSQPVTQAQLDAKTSIAVLPYSSGTTGKPKGVMLSHFNLVSNIIQTNSAQAYKDDDVALAVLPFFHIYGMQVLMNCLLAEGVPIVTLRRFDMEKVLVLIEEHRVTRFFAVPPIVLGLAKHPAVDQFDISSLRQVFSGAAPLGGELAEEASRRIDCPVVQGYGMTELSPVTHLTTGKDYKAGSSGTAVPDTDCRIVDEKGNDLPPGETGELWIRGPQVMLGYLNDPQATSDCLDEEGWLRTGDLALIDRDKHMYIVDRLKELIKYKGFQIAPAELEATIVAFPEVADVAVIGQRDDESGEVPKAYIVLRPDVELSLETINQRLRQELASYKQLGEADFVETIPKSPSGKILRRLLRDKLETK